MPQLIAMIIVVVGAMIYMFQTFGGTGDKIEGIAQKTSVITEINNIKNGVKLAARAEHIGVTGGTAVKGDAVSDLGGLAGMNYFAQQINEQLNDTKAADNKYNAISFGGIAGDTKPAMVISLVSNIKGAIPGIYVEFPSTGALADNAGFLEAQIATDLASIATIDRHATAASSQALPTGKTGLEARTPTLSAAGTNTDTDGKFIIYFNDFATNEVVLE